MTKPDAGKSGTFKIGRDVTISHLGLCAMQFTRKGIRGKPDHHGQCLSILNHLPKLLVNFIDTADSYGPDDSEHLIHKALHPYGDILIATKAVLVLGGPDIWRPLGRPEYLRQQALMSPRFMGGKQIGLWQLHWIDRNVPRDEQFGAIKSPLDEGLIQHAGLSGVSAVEIEATRKIFPDSTVQSRYNLIDRTSEVVLGHCERHGIGFLPGYPQAAGELAKPGSFLNGITKDHHATPGQVTLARLLKRSDVLLPIPGTSRVSHLKENVAAAEIKLSAEDLAALDVARRAVVGKH